MSNASLYDEDILLWSEQQAAIIRRLGQTRRDLPNELDVENVAEEVESVGRSELAAVKSHIRLILIHLIKLAIEPEADTAKHWVSEIFAFQAEMKDRYAPSMRQRINVDELWQQALRQSMLAYEGTPQQEMIAELPAAAIFNLDDFLTDPLDSAPLMERLSRPLSA